MELQSLYERIYKKIVSRETSVNVRVRTQVNERKTSRTRRDEQSTFLYGISLYSAGACP